MADPDTRESLTTIEAINATGDYAPAMIILPGFTLLEKYFDNNISYNVIFATNQESGSGYTNDMLAIDWLIAFEKATRPGTKTRKGTIHNGEWRLLLMDNHGSHLTKNLWTIVGIIRLCHFDFPRTQHTFSNPVMWGYFNL